MPKRADVVYAKNPARPCTRGVAMKDMSRRAATTLDVVLCLGLGFMSLLLYVRTLAPSVLESDAGEYQFVLTELGIAHPTGYPLYTVLGHLWSFLPIRTPAYRANLLSAVFGAATISALYVTLKRVTNRRGLAAAASLFMAVAPTFWSQMVLAGSYSLNALIFALFLYSLLRHIDGDWGVEPVLFAYGVGLTHHRTMILATPAVAYVLWLSRGSLRSTRHVAKLFALVAVPNLIWLYIPIRAHQLGREDLSTLGELVGFLLGKTFSRYWFMGGLQGLWEQVANWRALLVAEFGWPAVAVAVGGLVLSVFRRPPFAVSTLLLYVAHLAFNLNYRIGNIWMYYIPSYVLVLLWTVAFLDQVIAWCEDRLHGWASLRSISSHAVAIVILCVALVRMTTSFSHLDRSHEYRLEDYWLDALASPLKQGAVVLSDWNMHTPLVYYQRIGGLRRDLRPQIFSDEAIAHALDRGDTVYSVQLPSRTDGLVVSVAGPLYELRSQPRTLADVTIKHAIRATFDECLVLHGYDFAFLRRDASGAQRYLVTLYWSRHAVGACDPGVSVRLYVGDRVIGQADSAPVRGVYPLRRWQVAEVVVDQYILVVTPTEPVPQQADLKIAVYDASTLEPFLAKEQGQPLVSLASVPLR